MLAVALSATPWAWHLGRMQELRLSWLRLASVANEATRPWFDAALKLGDPGLLFESPRPKLLELGLTPRAAARLHKAIRREAAQALLARCRSLQIEVCVPGDSAYPDRLLHIPDPPLSLFWRGRPPGDCEQAVAIVGTREPSRYGAQVARELARDLAAAGAPVVSGLARGIDQCAHEGALGAGETAAVLPGGLDRVYPARNRSLCARILEKGWVLSERGPGVVPKRYDFPRRNRLVTGLAELVVVVEATRASGTWTSAMHAMEQGRQVFAVPGELSSPQAAGPNQLLRDGCPPLLEPADVLDLLDLPKKIGRLPNQDSGNLPSSCADKGNLEPEARALLKHLSGSAQSLEQLCAAAALDGAKVMALLTSLELAGLVTASHSGGYMTSGTAGATFVAAATGPSSRATDG